MATKTQEYLKALAGQRDLPSDVCCTTLTQDLIIDATNRVNALDEEVQQMKSNPDVFDIVGTQPQNIKKLRFNMRHPKAGSWITVYGKKRP